MRTSLRLLLSSATMALAACDTPKKEASEESFYPALSVIWADTKALDSLPLAVIRYREDESGTDTSIIEKSDFKRLSLDALSPDISKPPLSRFYREEVFMDRTLDRVVIRYSTEEPKAEIRLLELTLDPDSEKVRSIYVEKQSRIDDTLQTSKMIWSVGRQFQINLIRRVGNNPLHPVSERYVWGVAQ
jgi:hypothetical protein